MRVGFERGGRGDYLRIESNCYIHGHAGCHEDGVGVHDPLCSNRNLSLDNSSSRGRGRGEGEVRVSASSDECVVSSRKEHAK